MERPCRLRQRRRRIRSLNQFHLHWPGLPPVGAVEGHVHPQVPEAVQVREQGIRVRPQPRRRRPRQPCKRRTTATVTVTRMVTPMTTTVNEIEKNTDVTVTVMVTVTVTMNQQHLPHRTSIPMVVLVVVVVDEVTEEDQAGATHHIPMVVN